MTTEKKSSRLIKDRKELVSITMNATLTTLYGGGLGVCMPALDLSHHLNTSIVNIRMRLVNAENLYFKTFFFVENR